MTIAQIANTPIRKVNIRHDLPAVADLIEICFAQTLDDDGREYLRHLRWTARDMNYLSWLQGAAERVAPPLYGLVWEENGKIIGNLSLIPMNRDGKLIYLIANVAVHPDHRRRGIGRMLTQESLEHLRQRGIEVAWLQVRDDNPVAYHLYRSLGFVERARRTTWMSSIAVHIPPRLPEGYTIERRQIRDWEQQEAWLHEIYPPEIRWNLPLSIARLSPNPIKQIMRWLQGDGQEHWAACKSGKAEGYVSWEPMRSASDALWLATTPEHENEAVLALLPHARAALAGRGRQLSVNYPAGRASAAFIQAGFTHHQTLVWMSVALKS
jgi:ribosomal protein S18 acetylase RimI-like enzyme